MVLERLRCTAIAIGLTEQEIAVLAMMYRHRFIEHRYTREDVLKKMLPLRHREEYAKVLRELEKKLFLREVKREMWSLTMEGVKIAELEKELGADEIALSPERPAVKPLAEEKRVIMPFQVCRMWNDVFHIDAAAVTDEVDLPSPEGDFFVQDLRVSFDCPKCGNRSEEELKAGARFYTIEKDVLCNSCNRRIWRVRLGDLVRTRGY